MRGKIFVLSLLIAWSSLSVLASHHAFAPYFDTQQPFTFAGTVTRVDWVNPVVFVHLQVEDAATGQATLWALEGPSVKGMERFGLGQEMFPRGARIRVVGWMGRPGANLSETVADPELAARVKVERAASAAQFEFPDGRKFPLVSNVPELQPADR